MAGGGFGLRDCRPLSFRESTRFLGNLFRWKRGVFMERILVFWDPYNPKEI